MTPPPETHRDAIAAFVFSLLGWTALPLLGALLALYYSRRARNQIRTSHGDYSGHELAEAAATIAWVWLLLLLTALAVGVVFLTVLAVVHSQNV
jgi:uncharacterized membrane protein